MHKQKVHTHKKGSYNGELLTLHKIHVANKDYNLPPSVEVPGLPKHQTESLLYINSHKLSYYDKQWELEAHK